MWCQKKEIIILKKNTTILKSEEHLDHGNGNCYLLYMRLLKIPNDAWKQTPKGKNTEESVPTNPKGAEETTTNPEIKCKATGKTDLAEKEMKPHEVSDWDLKNDYAVLNIRKTKMKQEEKLHQSVKRRKKNIQRRKKTRKAAIMRKIRALE